jgi:hypothetical protein
MRARSLLAAGIVATTAIACADLFGFKDLQEGPSDASDAQAPDGGDSGGNDTGPSCTPATWPGNPTTTSSGTKNDFTIAMRHFYFTTTADGGVASFGYDQDGKCTTDNASASCTNAALITDLPNGVDDESVALMNSLISFAPSLQDSNINADIDQGKFTFLVRLHNYNGGLNQPLNQSLAIGVQTSPGIVGGPPNWDGNDKWNVSLDDSFSSTSTQPNAFINAYVNNGTLVAVYNGTVTLHVDLPGGGFVSGPMGISLVKPTMTATLVPNGNAWDLQNGLLVGRWPRASILSNVASLNFEDGGPLCDNSNIWKIVGQTVCQDMDLTSTGQDDNTTPCDAVSVAIAFDGVAANVPQNPVPFPTSTTPCDFDASACPDGI